MSTIIAPTQGVATNILPSANATQPATVSQPAQAAVASAIVSHPEARPAPQKSTLAWVKDLIISFFQTLLCLKKTSRSTPTAETAQAQTRPIVRELRLLDGTPLHNRTTNANVSLLKYTSIDVRWPPSITFNCIKINDRRIFFHANPDQDTYFGRGNVAEQVVVEDAADHGANWYRITQTDALTPGQTTPNVKTWLVDANKEFRYKNLFGLFGNEKIYVVESELSNLSRFRAVQRIR